MAFSIEDEDYGGTAGGETDPWAFSIEDDAPSRSQARAPPSAVARSSGHTQSRGPTQRATGAVSAPVSVRYGSAASGVSKADKMLEKYRAARSAQQRQSGGATTSGTGATAISSNIKPGRGGATVAFGRPQLEESDSFDADAVDVSLSPPDSRKPPVPSWRRNLSLDAGEGPVGASLSAPAPAAVPAAPSPRSAGGASRYKAAREVMVRSGSFNAGSGAPAATAAPAAEPSLDGITAALVRSQALSSLLGGAGSSAGAAASGAKSTAAGSFGSGSTGAAAGSSSTSSGGMGGTVFGKVSFGIGDLLADLASGPATDAGGAGGAEEIVEEDDEHDQPHTAASSKPASVQGSLTLSSSAAAGTRPLPIASLFPSTQPASAAVVPGAAAGAAAAAFPVGARVEVRYRRGGEWLPAVVRSAAARLAAGAGQAAGHSYVYSVRYEDGDAEDGVTSDCIRAAAAAGAGSGAGAGARASVASGTAATAGHSRPPLPLAPASPQQAGRLAAALAAVGSSPSPRYDDSFEDDHDGDHDAHPAHPAHGQSSQPGQATSAAAAATAAQQPARALTAGASSHDRLQQLQSMLAGGASKISPAAPAAAPAVAAGGDEEVTEWVSEPLAVAPLHSFAYSGLASNAYALPSAALGGEGGMYGDGQALMQASVLSAPADEVDGDDAAARHAGGSAPEPRPAEDYHRHVAGATADAEADYSNDFEGASVSASMSPLARHSRQVQVPVHVSHPQQGASEATGSAGFGSQPAAAAVNKTAGALSRHAPATSGVSRSRGAGASAAVAPPPLPPRAGDAASSAPAPAPVHALGVSSAPRFDPYTGQPLVPEATATSALPVPRFDPYTGQPLPSPAAGSTQAGPNGVPGLSQPPFGFGHPHAYGYPSPFVAPAAAFSPSPGMAMPLPLASPYLGASMARHAPGGPAFAASALLSPLGFASTALHSPGPLSGAYPAYPTHHMAQHMTPHMSPYGQFGGIPLHGGPPATAVEALARTWASISIAAAPPAAPPHAAGAKSTAIDAGAPSGGGHGEVHGGNGDEGGEAGRNSGMRSERDSPEHSGAAAAAAAASAAAGARASAAATAAGSSFFGSLAAAAHPAESAGISAAAAAATGAALASPIPIPPHLAHHPSVQQALARYQAVLRQSDAVFQTQLATLRQVLARTSRLSSSSSSGYGGSPADFGPHAPIDSAHSDVLGDAVAAGSTRPRAALSASRHGSGAPDSRRSSLAGSEVVLGDAPSHRDEAPINYSQRPAVGHRPALAATTQAVAGAAASAGGRVYSLAETKAQLQATRRPLLTFEEAMQRVRLGDS